jgi:CubicO group peptidase (beta-lactamase class C family)
MSSMSSSSNTLAGLGKTFSKAVEEGVFPGAVIAATNRDGSFYHSEAFGRRGCDSTEKPLTTKSVMAIASMTKLMTTIAALQLVERQLVDLDQDVSSLVPTLAAQEILESWDKKGRPITRKRETTITLRHLLTHSSGAGYDMSNAELAKFTAYNGREINSGATVEERFGYPLLFEPGTSWEYGTGIDWAGQLVERVTGQDLETYMQEHIWTPLGIRKITFWPSSNTEMQAERVQMTIRDGASGHLVPLQRPFLTEGVTECFGGQGAYAAIDDFLKVLRSILTDDEKLLKKTTTAMMFQSQLSPASRESLRKHVHSCGSVPAFIGIFDNSRTYDFGLGGMLAVDGEPSGRKRGTLFWSGKPNCFWVSLYKQRKKALRTCSAETGLSSSTATPISAGSLGPRSFHLVTSQ